MDRQVKFTNIYGDTIRRHIRADNEEELQRKIKKIQMEINYGPTINTVIDKWIDDHESEIRYNTQMCYVAPIKDIREYFGKKHINEITPVEIDVFLKRLYQDYRWAKQTLKLRLIVLNQVYNYSILHGYVTTNPCSAVKITSKAKSKKRELPSDNDLEKVKKSINDEFGLFAFLLMYTGCRRGEALALRYEDINRKEKTITINKTIVFQGNNPVVQNHTKSIAGYRTVPLLPPLEKVLPKKAKGFIFEKDGMPLNKGVFCRRWNKYVTTHNIDTTPHGLRHAYATILYEAGIQTKDAQLLLGHASSEITQEIYTHISEKQQKKTFNKLLSFIEENG